MIKLTVALLGESTVAAPNEINRRLFCVIYDLAARYENIDFLIGQDGVFDLLAVSAFHKAKYIYDCNNIRLTLLLSHLHPEHTSTDYWSYYDSAVVCRNAIRLPMHEAVKVRNIEMIDSADLVVCWVEHKEDAAWEAVQYASQKHKTIINLLDDKNFPAP